MFKPKPFANALALTSAIAYVVFYLLALVAPKAFAFLFNAQFLGADIASQVPANMSLGSFIGVLVGIVVITWILGYIWAYFYNRFSK